MDLVNVPTTCSVSQGRICLTSQQHASVSQGWICLTSQQHAGVSQGWIWLTSQQHASVSQGWICLTSQQHASVSQGRICLTSQQHVSVSQGRICLTSQQHASVSQGRICSDNCTCCHIKIEATDQTFYLTQSHYTDTGPTSPSADLTTPGAWQGSHWSTNHKVTGLARPRKLPKAKAGIEPESACSRGGRLNHSANEALSQRRRCSRGGRLNH